VTATSAPMLDVEIIKDAVSLACRAPSLHNSQPWRWVRDRAGLQLLVDPSRAVHTDDTSREALISCGAALDHLRVALAAAGWRAVIERFPDPHNPAHLACITFERGAAVTGAQRRRADSILLRRTDRLPLAAPRNWAAVEALLAAELASGPVRLHTLPTAARSRLAEVSQFSEALRLYDGEYHAELDWWTAPFEVADGIPQSALISASESDRVDVGRVFPVTRAGQRRADLGEDQAAILVLSTPGDRPTDALGCGEALSTVLLQCAAAGLATCPLTHVTEVATSRAMVAALIGDGDDVVPQVLIRVGTAPAIENPPPPTPRHPVSEVLAIEVA